ncbi:protein adenylyltransferase SelO family protein [Methylotenera sp.]|uniref:protein adenylyltransferase SelO n=1 Tax=Methylotenera sp. TaxID=2051956 RepID=UPI002487FD52|nr:YdiU family protein [Methylotenera sp.]MDI1362490.1 YdiU family protein [Methylotenera sp.]
MKDSKQDLNEAFKKISVTSSGWNFDNSYTRLPKTFFVKQKPTPVKAPHIVLFNQSLAATLGLNAKVLLEDEASLVFSGNTIPTGAEPIAQAYAGHQFGHLNMLGDGRAILLGEHLTPEANRYDIQLKGAGVTAYSRRGDGRAALGPMLREYIISEAMYALGIPTTRSLAVVTTGEPVYRDSILPGAILTRVATSHIRVGTFQFAASHDDPEIIRTLADYTLNRHFHECISTENKYLSLLNAVIDKQAKLIAQWMHIGFIHGVMNTDNMSICGESIDFGPCAFMDSYDPATVFSSIDQQGRYAFGNQPPIAQWNLTRFAETLLPLIHQDLEEAIRLAEKALKAFSDKYQQYWLAGMRAKLGLLTEEPDDLTLIEELLNCMKKYRIDYTNTFRDLSSSLVVNTPISAEKNIDTPDFITWHHQWRKRLSSQTASLDDAIALMLKTNPAVIPRNHQVEAALSAAESGDFTVLEKLLEVLSQPFKDDASHMSYRNPPLPTAMPYKTFCGT